MALTPLLQRLATPFGTELPGDPDALLLLIQEYMEIIGLEDFNGINYGATTPDAANRDKPWFKLGGGGEFLGIYIWDGADWVLTRPRFPELTETQMNAIAAPQGGEGIWHVGSSCVKVYDTATASWKRAIPEGEVVAYDRTYLFDTHQLIASPSSASGGWLPIDLTSLKSAAGISGETLKAVIISLRLNIQHASVGVSSADGALKAHGTNTVSTSATDVLFAYTNLQINAGNASDSDTVCGPVKMSGNTVYYCLNLSTITSPGVATVSVVGFIY